MTSLSNREDRYLPPRVLQLVGLGMFISFAIFWAFTGKESVLLIGMSGTLIFLGRYERITDPFRVVSQTNKSPDTHS